MRRTRASGDEGVVLIISLITIAVVSLLLAGLLSLSNASQSNTRETRDHDGKVYAADAGIDYGLQALRRDNTLCPAVSGSPALISTQTFNGRQVDIKCQTLSGSATGLSGYAVIALDGSVPTNTIATQGGGTQTIDGPVWTAALDTGIKLTVKNGDVFQQTSATCTSSTTEASYPNLTLQPTGAYHLRCVPPPAPTVVATLPTIVPLPALPPVTSPNGKCTTFFPGKYTSLTLNSQDNYFVSGVYYFDNIDNITVVKQGGVPQQSLVGGAASPGEQQNISTAGCATDPLGTVGTGVKFILGGDSSFMAGNPKGQIELFSRQGGPATEGTQGISLMTVTGTPVGWDPSSLTGTSSPVIGVDQSNSGGELAVHGMVYAPNAGVQLGATNAQAAQLQGGAVVGRLFIKSSGSATGLVVAIKSGTGVRRTVVTATAKGVGRDVIATAVVTIDTTPARSVTIESWRSS